MIPKVSDSKPRVHAFFLSTGYGLTILLALLLATACGVSKCKRRKLASGPKADVWIDETTVGSLDNIQAGVGNIWKRKYRLYDGSVRNGLTATLSFWDDSNPVHVDCGKTELDLGKNDDIYVKVELGVGSKCQIGQTWWQVVGFQSVHKMRSIGLARIKRLTAIPPSNSK